MEPLHAVPTSTTNPHVKVVDIDMSFRGTWWTALKKALMDLGSSLDDDIKVFWDSNIGWRVDGWDTSFRAGNDGYALVRSSRRRILRRYKEILRITGPKLGTNDTGRPESIECLLYELDLTDQVREMLAALGRELGVNNHLTLYRHNIQTPWVWRWRYTTS